MKILIKDQQGGMFVKGADAWTTDAAQALPFPDAIAAMEFCARHHLRGTKVLLKFSDERFDIALQPRRFPWIIPPGSHSRLISRRPSR